MDIPALKILLIEDNEAEVELFRIFLEEVIEIPPQITVTERLSQALEQLATRCFDIVTVDLSLPDSHGLDTLVQVKAKSPHTPIIVLTMLNDQTLAIKAVRQGAQDYLVKGKFDGELLLRAINYAIERQRIKRELQQQIERERLMGRMIERIRQSLKLDKILNTTVEEVRQFLQTDRVLIYRCQNHRQGTIVANSSDPDKDRQHTQILERSLQHIHNLANSSETPQILSSIPFNLDQWINTLANSFLTVPIWQHHLPQQYHLWGQLVAYDYSGTRTWETWEVEFLTQLANQVAIALKQSQLYETLENIAHQDGLTGIANRRYFDLILEREWKRLAREKQPLSLIMCDVDFFKNYNEFHPQFHLGGDDCLKKIAHILEKVSKRSSDIAFRYGGEEFVIILPNTNTEGVLTVASNIRDALAQQRLLHPHSPISHYVTLSVGIATQIPHYQQNPLSIVQKADNALKKAKEQGRNRIIVYE